MSFVYDQSLGSTCFCGCELFFAIRLYNRNDSHLNMSDLHSWLNGQSVALYKREIASSDPNGVLLPVPQWQRRAITF
jgi:hypothetical protein